MRAIVVVFSLLGVLSAAWGDEATLKPNDQVLMFDAKKIEPPNEAKGRPVARLFYDYIYPADLKAKDRILTEEEGRRLTGVIFAELQARYLKEHKIEVAAAEVEEFVASVEKGTPVEPGRSNEEREQERQGLKAIGEQLVKRWKFDRALYQQYGGTVIFQQANPFEPVGAYRAFLKKAEQEKLFEIYDEANRTRFWHYFTRKHPFEVPAARVNFEKPWWMLNVE